MSSEFENNEVDGSRLTEEMNGNEIEANDMVSFCGNSDPEFPRRTRDVVDNDVEVFSVTEAPTSPVNEADDMMASCGEFDSKFSRIPRSTEDVEVFSVDDVLRNPNAMEMTAEEESEDREPLDPEYCLYGQQEPEEPTR